MINIVAHLADVHIKNDLSTHPEYITQFKKLYKDLKSKKPDRIVVVGDITHDYLSCSYEVEILAVDFLVNLTKIAPTIVVEGNHCIRKSDLKRTSALKNFVTTIKKSNPNIKLTHYASSGFFEDDNIIWVNHSHLEKAINPWVDIQHDIDASKTYIDLFHDPILGCSNDIGYKFESNRLRNISDFKGDLGMFGDIHKHQYLNKEKTIAYASSTIQQNFGETPDKHGYMLWDIQEKSGQLIALQTEYTKLNFYIEPGFDYDKILFNHDLITDNSFIKVHWKDISANINDDNEGKINKHFRGFNISNEIIYDKNRIYTDISDSELLTENIDINDKEIQQKIFLDYLTLNGYEEDFIQEILKIDDIVEEMIENKSEMIQTNWKIDKFWLDNFKSYENVEIDWKDMNGIIQLYSEENQQGKTTLLDGICYITHGTTLSTNKLGGAKKEKNGDQRYINNKKDLDYCSGGMIVDINNTKYAIIRNTDREWSKGKKKVSSVKTSVEYYRDGIIDEAHKIVGERKTETQAMLDKLIVDFDDFIRLTLINSFNINELIAMDRATFIDSIIKDAGYDIFEKKLDLFKAYKKTLVDDRIVLELDSAEEEISGLKILLKTYKSDYDETKNNIDETEKSIKDILIERDTEYRKFNKIDDDILEIDVQEIESKINDYENKIELNDNSVKINSDKLSSLKSTYDSDEYESLLKQLKTIEDVILNLKLKISQVENSDLTLTAKLENVSIKKEQLVKDKINEYRQHIKDGVFEIDNLNQDFENQIDKETQKHKSSKIGFEFDIKTLKQKLSSIKEKGIAIKQEIKELETSNVCPTCFREYDSDEHEHSDAIEEKKAQLEQKIQDLMPDVKKYKNSILDLELNVTDLKSILLDIETGKYDSELEGLKKNLIKKIDDITSDNIDKLNKITLLERNDLSELEDDFKKLTDFEIKINAEIEKNVILLKTGNMKLKDKLLETDVVEKKIQILRIEKEEVSSYTSLVTTNTQLELQNEKMILLITNAKNVIGKYHDNKIFIEQNSLINDKINKYDSQIKVLEQSKQELTDNLNDILNESNVMKESGEEIKKKIVLYKKQVRQDEIYKVYQKCVHRDGIPFYLLMKSRDLINQELSDILSSVNFNVYFDEKMNLKMFMEFAKNVIQNTLEGSGAEKAFSAIALKLALRSINNNSRPNFLLLDEVTGNLKGKSVDNFNLMLEKMKERIDKVIIIEQNHPINYEYGIEVLKDDKGISSLKIIK